MTFACVGMYFALHNMLCWRDKSTNCLSSDEVCFPLADCLLMMVTTAWLSQNKSTRLLAQCFPHRRKARTIGKSSNIVMSVIQPLFCHCCGHLPLTHSPWKYAPKPWLPAASVKSWRQSDVSHWGVKKIVVPLKWERNCFQMLRSARMSFVMRIL